MSEAKTARALDEILDQASARMRALEEGGLAALITEAAGLGRAVLVAERDRLVRVEQRCIVSRQRRQFLDLVLGALPAA